MRKIQIQSKKTRKKTKNYYFINNTTVYKLTNQQNLFLRDRSASDGFAMMDFTRFFVYFSAHIAQDTRYKQHSFMLLRHRSFALMQFVVSMCMSAWIVLATYQL